MKQQPVQHPIACPLCNARWDFGTDALGRLVAVHPVTKCVPPPPPQYERDDIDEFMDTKRKCEECGKEFSPRKASNSQVLCSGECRKVRRERQKQESEARRGKWWRLSTMDALNLPTKECSECKKLFTVTGKFGKKAIVCSMKCRISRKARQDKDRKAA